MFYRFLHTCTTRNQQSTFRIYTVTESLLSFRLTHTNAEYFCIYIARYVCVNILISPASVKDVLSQTRIVYPPSHIIRRKSSPQNIRTSCVITGFRVHIALYMNADI